MSLSAGIVGLPNVGKSTLFNALSTAQAESANYPFCTIDPNVGIIEVPDPRREAIAEIIGPDESHAAVVEFFDIAGLVEGASEGEGLGNKFLANIREVDALVHMVRCFEDDDVAHVEGSVDPVRDVDIVETELILADLETVAGRLEKARRAAKGDDKEAAARAEVLQEVQAALQAGEPARTVDLEPREAELLHDSHLLTRKPVLFVANVGEDEVGEDNEHVRALRNYADAQSADVLVLSAALEAELSALPDEERAEMLEMFGLEEPALDRLVRRTYELLGLQTFFTIANDKLRAWPCPVGATAPEAAGIVHSDFEDRFIRAEVFTVEDLREYGSEKAIRDAGNLRTEGKDYVVQDGDILRIKHDA